MLGTVEQAPARLVVAPEPSVVDPVVSSAMAGDPVAFRAVVQRYGQAVYGLCRRYLGEAEGEDVAQETFLRAFLNKEKFDTSRPILPWLLTIARRLCLNRLRSRGHAPTVCLDEVSIGETGKDPECLASSRQSLDIVSQGLSLLPEGQREVLSMYHVEGMSYQQCAQALEVPIGTIMTWLHRGRARLRALLEAKDKVTS
jgi:RNA polymerase sigma-70 factor (ECF subfamily)